MVRLLLPLALGALLVPAQGPSVQADKTVTFHFRAPNAQKVEVSMDNGRRFPLTKNEKGIWATWLVWRRYLSGFLNQVQWQWA